MTVFRVATFFRCLSATLLAMASVAQAQGSVHDQGQAAKPPARILPTLRNGAHDFDFEFGSWKAHVSRRLHPLTGSLEWIELDGISTVHKVWDGKANLGELDVKGPASAILGLSLRLYDPATHEWKISWANIQDGQLTPAMIGVFDGAGNGEFYSADSLAGRQILVRFIFTPVRNNHFRIEQAFSGDLGRTWEVNWIADFQR